MSASSDHEQAQDERNAVIIDRCVAGDNHMQQLAARCHTAYPQVCWLKAPCQVPHQTCGGARHVWVEPVVWGIAEAHHWGSSTSLWGLGYVVQPGDMVGYMECVGVCNGYSRLWDSPELLAGGGVKYSVIKQLC